MGCRDRCRRWTVAALLSVALCAVDAADEPAPDPGVSVGQDVRIEEMTLRLLGMEGKLRESAQARKSADQARMEAERRLAEGIREIERLTAEVDRLKGVQLALEQALAERDRQLAQVDARTLSLETQNEALDRKLEALRARVPIRDGGTLTAEQARQAAEESYRTLRGALKGSDAASFAEVRTRIAAAEDDLHQRQLTLARTSAAQGVYRVRANDSLVLISSRCYGDGSRWGVLFDANRHVLEDPNQLLPGVSLIIP